MGSVLSEQLTALVQPLVEAQGAYLIETAVRGQQGGRVVEVFIDADDGVTTELCAAISRDVAQAIDATDLIKQRYYLVVSSPGLERPLKFQRQYRKNVGRRLKIKYRQQDKVEQIEGNLVEVSEEQIVVGDKGNASLAIPFSAIVETIVLPTL